MSEGNTPQVIRSGETPGSKRLFHSIRDIALIKDKTVEPGYGTIFAGTAMAVSTFNSKLIPYVPIGLAAYGTVCVVPALATLAATATTISVPLASIKRFTVGASLILQRNNSGNAAYHDGGAIVSAAKVNDYSALVTFTTALDTDANFTTANFASCFIKGDASSPFTKAVYILDKDIYTGEGEDAMGANTSVVISNAILYTTSLLGWDAAAATDMSAITDGAHTIFK